MIDVFTVRCTHCDTAFPVDPNKVPEVGIRARCSVCGGIFRVEVPSEPPTESGEEPRTPVEPRDGIDEAGEAGVEEPGGREPEPRSREPEPRQEAPEPREGIEAPPVEEGAEPWGEVKEPEEEGATPGGAEERTTAWGERGAASVEEEEETAELEEERPKTTPVFGQRTPEEKARRLARVLVSDMISYNPELHETALARGTLAQDFEEEIEKSWEEYVEQVGEELANATSYWTDALNEILAQGNRVF